MLVKLGKVCACKKLGLVAYGILRTEFVNAGDGVECTVNPDVRLDCLSDIRGDSAEFFFTAVCIDDGEFCPDGNIGHIGIFVVE